MGLSSNQNAGYSKTDLDFTTARSVIRIVSLVVKVIFALGILGGLITAITSRAVIFGLSSACGSLLMLLFTEVAYSFLIGFFELIKHAREIRNELVGLRSRPGSTVPTASAQSNTNSQSGVARYDSATHQYIKS